VGEDGQAVATDVGQGLERQLHLHALRHVHEGPPGAERRVQRRELRAVERDRVVEPALDQVRVVAERGVDALEPQADGCQ
jgi:hypothetical protein